MLSFISNFRNKWFLAWASALALSFILIAALEILLRQWSYSPTIVDDEKLWAMQREKVGKEANQIVLTGSSRMLTDISVTSLRTHFPAYKIINLAIDGSCPNNVLIDLSKDTSFHGAVLVDFREECLFFGNEEALSGQSFINYANRSFNLNAKLNRIFASFVQKNLILIDPYMNIFKVIGSFVLNKEPRKPRYWQTDEDRIQMVDYRKVNIAKMIDSRMPYVLEMDEKFRTKKNDVQFNTNVADLSRAISAINKRGGAVFFVRLPLDSIEWNRENGFFPREKYWDPVCQKLQVYQIHYKDYPQLRVYGCPDHSHIDFRDKNDLTDKLSAILGPLLIAPK